MKKNMRRLSVFFLVLFLALSGVSPLGFSAARAYEKEITFAGIPWLSDMATAERMLLEQGIIGEKGKDKIDTAVGRLSFYQRMMQKGSGFRYDAFVPTDDGRYRFSREEVGTNIVQIHLMSSDVISEWMGHQVHNIALLYTFDGQRTRLVSATVSLMVSDLDATDQLKEMYGRPAYFVHDENSWDGNLWIGSGNTGLFYSTSEFHYGLLNAVELVNATGMAVELTPEPQLTRRPTPVPTASPTPTPEPAALPTPAPESSAKDILEMLKAGNIQFPGLPWGTNLEDTMSALALAGIFNPAKAANYRSWLSDGALYLYEKNGQILSNFTQSPRIQSFTLYANSHGIRKTFGGYPIESVNLDCSDAGGLFALQFTLEKVRGGDEAVAKLAASLEPFFGPGQFNGYSWLWRDDAGNALQITFSGTWCYVLMGHLTSPDTF